MRAVIVFVITLLSSLSAFAQATDIEMADTFRAEGKIYVVVAVVLIILIGLFAYLIHLDRKLAKLERSDKYHGE
ncbi:MAG: CcmD family protein [Candidatus Cyclobacteriaceae bacterium M2_1C_046]